MIRLNPPAIRDAIFVFLVAFACMYVGPAVADELRFSYEFDGSGGCDKDGHAYAAEYRMNRGDLSGHAFVQHKPSGGDCRRNSLNFDVGLEQDFDTGVHGIHAQAKFLAQESATARPYALVIDGAIATRADGNALFETILPAGRAQAIAAILGLSRDCSFGKVEMECDAGFNVVPTDWAAHDEGRTAHFGLTAKWREFDFELKFDVGKGKLRRLGARLRAGHRHRPAEAARRVPRGVGAQHDLRRRPGLAGGGRRRLFGGGGSAGPREVRYDRDHLGALTRCPASTDAALPRSARRTSAAPRSAVA